MRSDREIIERVLGGDRNAYEEILLRYEVQVFRWLARMLPFDDVREAAQEVFVRAYRDLGGYRAEAPLQHWLSRIARNVAYDYWRKVRRDRLVPTESSEIDRLSEGATSADEDASDSRERELLHEALDLLSPDQRLVFSLFYLDERSIREIASELGLSVANVKIRLYRARKSIQKFIGRETHE